MRAIQIAAPKELRRIEIPEPPAPGPGEALVRTHRVGICGTDLGGYLGKMPFFSYPRVIGHELGVEVLEVGAGVTNVAPGDRCSVEPYMNCGKCLACRKGMTNCCPQLKVLGVMTEGGLCDRFTLPAHKLHPSTKLSMEQLALVETLGIGCHAVDRSGLVASETCLVIGAGPIGLACIEFVKLAGAKCLVLDMNEQRLKFCREVMKVDQTLQPSDRLLDQLRELTGGDLPEVVIDASGSAASMAAAFGYIAPTGRLVFVGITQQEVIFKHPIFHRPEGTLLCSRNSLPKDFRRIIRLIEEGQIDTVPWITHRTPFDRVCDEFESFTKPETGVIKAVVEVNS